MEPKRKPTRLRKRNLDLKLNVTETKAPSTCYLLPLYLTFWGLLAFQESGERKAAIVTYLTRGPRDARRLEINSRKA